MANEVIVVIEIAFDVYLRLRAMRVTSGKRVLAVFVLGFLCLNAAGALCLTYCSSLFSAEVTAVSDDSHLSEHCKAMKEAAETKLADETRDAVASAEASCCMMPVAMFAVPVEKRSTFETVDVAVVPAKQVDVPQFEYVAAVSFTNSIPVYRPPPLDRRIERSLNCVIRI